MPCADLWRIFSPCLGRYEIRNQMFCPCNHLRPNSYFLCLYEYCIVLFMCSASDTGKRVFEFGSWKWSTYMYCLTYLWETILRIASVDLIHHSFMYSLLWLLYKKVMLFYGERWLEVFVCLGMFYWQWQKIDLVDPFACSE